MQGRDKFSWSGSIYLQSIHTVHLFICQAHDRSTGNYAVPFTRLLFSPIESVWSWVARFQDGRV